MTDYSGGREARYTTCMKTHFTPFLCIIYKVGMSDGRVGQSVTSGAKEDYKDLTFNLNQKLCYHY